MESLVTEVVQHVVRVLVQVAVVIVAFGLIALPASLIFPSTRAALGRWLRRPSRGALDQGDALAQLAAANAQLAALRNEVHALRCEVASSAALRGAPPLASLAAPGTREGDATGGGATG